MLGQILRYGLPSGVQNSVIAIANVVVQSNINTFGDDAMAGCGSYSRVEGFAFLPITCFSLSLTTFIGQNLGAKKFDRAKAGAKFGILCSVIMAEVIGGLIWILAPLLHRSFHRLARGDRIGHAAGAHGIAVLFPIGVFPLYRGHLPRRGQSERSHVYHARLLVPDPYSLYHRRHAFHSQYRRRFLGVSAHLGAEFYRLSLLLPLFRLDTRIRTP